MEEVTGNLIGETETLLITGMAGVFYGLFSCQPLTILAFTGPLLLFEEVVFAVSGVSRGAHRTSLASQPYFSVCECALEKCAGGNEK